VNCPECGIPAKTLSTRLRKDGTKRRRFECVNKHRFTTVGTAQKLSITPKTNPHKDDQTLT
jgi:transcriptional regulator NrdR family protein